MPTSGRTASRSYTTLTSRRTWSLAEKSVILAEMAVPGAIVMAVARRHGIAQHEEVHASVVAGLMHVAHLIDEQRDLLKFGPAQR